MLYVNVKLCLGYLFSPWSNTYVLILHVFKPLQSFNRSPRIVQNLNIAIKKNGWTEEDERVVIKEKNNHS